MMQIDPIWTPHPSGAPPRHGETGTGQPRQASSGRLRRKYAAGRGCQPGRSHGQTRGAAASRATARIVITAYRPCPQRPARSGAGVVRIAVTRRVRQHDRAAQEQPGAATERQQHGGGRVQHRQGHEVPCQPPRHRRVRRPAARGELTHVHCGAVSEHRDRGPCDDPDRKRRSCPHPLPHHLSIAAGGNRSHHLHMPPSNRRSAASSGPSAGRRGTAGQRLDRQGSPRHKLTRDSRSSCAETPSANRVSQRGQSATSGSSSGLARWSRPHPPPGPAATAGRFAASRAACSSVVSRSADRRRTTEGRVAPRLAASSSPKSLSAETITSALARGIVEDAPVGCRQQAYIADVNRLQPGLAQGDGNPRRQVGVDEEAHDGYAGWASGSSRSCRAAAANSRAARTSARSRYG